MKMALGDLNRPFVIGVVHLEALPGSPGCAGQSNFLANALLDARALIAGGVDGIMLENFGDVPFFADQVPPTTVAQMTLVATEIRRIMCEASFSGPLGINVLRNDSLAALAIAQATGARAIRVNVLQGARLTDQGIIQGRAAELLRARAALDARDIAILADVQVKHSTSLGPEGDLGDETEDLIHRGGADAVIVSGRGTGKAVDPKRLAIVKAAAGTTPVILGSGLTLENAADLLAHADGVIVGTYFKSEGRVEAPVDTDRVRTLMKSLVG